MADTTDNITLTYSWI